MENYTADILKASRNSEDRLVFNKGPEHASVLMSTLFDSAKQTICIYSKMLNNDVTNNDIFLNSFERILSDDTIEVKILLEEQTNNQNIINLFEQYKNYNNEYRIIENNNILKKIKDRMIEVIKKDIHFTTIDDKAYRIEDDIKYYKAFASFNGIKLATSLKNFFLDLYNNYK